MAHNNHSVIIFGPTGVGKSSLADLVALHLNGEIINADVGQFYVPCTIGTAKPQWQKSPIVHHLFDWVDQPKNVTVFTYRQAVAECIQLIQDRNKLPIIVGGSTFYIQSLFFPPYANTIEHVDDDYHEEDKKTLWQTLAAIDPQRAQAIHPKDTYRLERALALWRQTGRKPSTFKPTYRPIDNFHAFFFTRNREDLYARIDKRTTIMLQEGWIDEVKKLLDTPWEKFLVQKRLIGYDDIISYLRNGITMSELDEIIAQKTRQYAKRQVTFFRMLEKKILLERKENPHNTFAKFNLTEQNEDSILSSIMRHVLHEKC